MVTFFLKIKMPNKNFVPNMCSGHAVFLFFMELGSRPVCYQHEVVLGIGVVNSQTAPS